MKDDIVPAQSIFREKYSAGLIFLQKILLPSPLLKFLCIYMNALVNVYVYRGFTAAHSSSKVLSTSVEVIFHLADGFVIAIGNCQSNPKQSLEHFNPWTK